MKILLRRTLLLTLTALTLLLSGCASLWEQETLLPSDLTVVELEKRMNRAMDPGGNYAKASSYIQRQSMSVGTLWGETLYLVEIRYAKPNKFTMSLLQDNRLVSKLILNGDNAWIADYTRKKVTPLTGDSLVRVKLVYGIGQPGSSSTKLFKDVKVSLCSIGDEEYYKLDCTSPISGEGSLNIYVGRDSFLTRRIRCSLEVKDKVEQFESISRDYTMRDGVMLPAEIQVSSDGGSRVARLIDFRLNPHIEESEFLPPVFSL